MQCQVRSGVGVATKDSSKWFQEWANQYDIALFPGTLNAIPIDGNVLFPDNYICLNGVIT
jgi:hypothetical protein